MRQNNDGGCVQLYLAAQTVVVVLADFAPDVDRSIFDQYVRCVVKPRSSSGLDIAYRSLCFMSDRRQVTTDSETMAAYISFLAFSSFCVGSMAPSRSRDRVHRVIDADA